MISIINYGMGNLKSITNALEFLHIPCRIISSPEEVLQSEKVILPGVGSFKKAMENIHAGNLFEPVKEVVQQKGIPILGICLGMQLLTASSDEESYTEGFGFIPEAIKKFEFENTTLKVPHIGFNSVNLTPGNSLLFKGLKDVADFYFVHSYKVGDSDNKYVAGKTTYGEPFVSAFQVDNIFGTQFHPEKSQSNGLTILKNFAAL
jgi:glutamine amidotransferase